MGVFLFGFVAFALSGVACFAESIVEIKADPNCRRNIGGVTDFRREQFITVHETVSRFGKERPEEDFMVNELEVCFGRDGGSMSGGAKRLPADPKNTEMPDLKTLQKNAKKRLEKLSPRDYDAAASRETVVCMHPQFLHATPHNEFAEWGPRNFDAVADYVAHNLKYYYDDKSRPRYLEVLNEPFVHAKEIGTTIDAMCEQHNVVADRVREINPDVLVGGYTAAWVEVESRNFGHWNDWQKRFMDLAGEKMDFWSYHIYDGVNVVGSPRNRTGSNSEAIMDLIDTYSFMKFGKAKPILISEYGKIPEGGMDNHFYSPKRSAEMIRSMNGQLMTFMDHPDRLLKTIPFVLAKGMWTYDTPSAAPGKANPFLLWRKTETGEFVKTDLIMFYQFWKGVSGEWRECKSSNPDVRVHLLGEKRRLILALSNIDTNPQTLSISGFENVKAKSLVARRLKTDGEAPTLTEEKMSTDLKELTLAAGESVLLTYELRSPLWAKSEVEETRYYATDYLQSIDANAPVNFEFEKVKPAAKGTAVLRVSSGRELGKSIRPSSVNFNGSELKIPSNWAGDDQAGRSMFFGMLEFDVPVELIQETNNVSIKYPDRGGTVASVVLQVHQEK